MRTPRVGVILLTFNSASVVERTITAARQVSDHIIAVDSHSTDGTQELLTRLGCEVLTRSFVHYADQRNWAIEHLRDRFDWQLHLDADEVLDATAIKSVSRALTSDLSGQYGYILHRRTHFLGRALRFGGATNWHLRLFRSGMARCEDRLYDQHFVTTLPTKVLAGWLDDLNVGNLTEWTARHNRWSSLEAQELSRRRAHAPHQIEARLSADPRERIRLYKGAYYRAPRVLRVFAYFSFRYILQLGFLDGRAGFYYAVLQAFWFRLLVDAKLTEIDLAAKPD
jgi:glycosyltransferase involved in cell wall biosynthesis